jgi:hypothetical protein
VVSYVFLGSNACAFAGGPPTWLDVVRNKRGKVNYREKRLSIAWIMKLQ